MTSGKVHIHGETGELVTRADVVWKEGYETAALRERIVKNLYPEHLKDKIRVMEFYKASVKQ